MTIDFLRIFTVAIACIGVIQPAKAYDAFFGARFGPNNVGDFDLTLSFNHYSGSPVTSSCTYYPAAPGGSDNLACTPPGRDNGIVNQTISLIDSLGHGSDFRVNFSATRYSPIDGVYTVRLLAAIYGSCDAAQDTCEDIVGTATLFPEDELVNIPGLPNKLISTKTTTEKVPAPLPILGIAASIGSLKKLRRLSHYKRNMSASS